MDRHRLLQAISEIVVREEGDDGEALLFVPATERVKVLNRTGLFLWNCCDGAHSRADLVDELARAYPGTDRATLRTDVESFVDALLALGLVAEVGAL